MREGRGHQFYHLGRPDKNSHRLRRVDRYYQLAVALDVSYHVPTARVLHRERALHSATTRPHMNRTFGSTSGLRWYDENAYLKPLLGSSARVVQLDFFVQAFYNIQVVMLPEGAIARPPAGQLSSVIVCLITLKHIWHYLVLFPR